MFVNDATIEKTFIEPDQPGDPFEVLDADTLWRHLRLHQKTLGLALMLARHGCPHCRRAKELLRAKRVPFEAVHLGDELTMQGVKAAAGTATVPQVFIDDHLIGGTDQLAAYLQQQQIADREARAG
jgi:glutaredoxin